MCLCEHDHVPNDLSVLLVLPFAVSPLAEHDRGVHVGRREGVGLIKQGDDAQQDGPANTNTENMLCIHTIPCI